MIIHVFITAGQTQNETKIKTSLRARGPPGVSGALHSLRILHIGRIGSGFNAAQRWHECIYTAITAVCFMCLILPSRHKTSI